MTPLMTSSNHGEDAMLKSIFRSPLAGVAVAAIATVAACSGRVPSSAADLGGPADMASGPPPCSAHDPCPMGGTCRNGECVSACATDKDCPTGQICGMTDYVCHDPTVKGCPDSPCGAKQICVNGLCSTPPPGHPCGLTPFSPADGCDMQSVCITDALADGKRVPDPNCYTFPDCPPDGNCPVSSSGSVCNDGILPNKARICLGGICKVPANCPPKWQCVFPADKAYNYGKCTDGSSGAPCTKAADCISSTCKGDTGEFGACT
jgi:hypothetical protein